MVKVKATVDLQFRPTGEDYAYPNGNSTIEKKKLETLLKVCGDIGGIFGVLLPEDKRKKWWKTLEFDVPDSQVPIEVVKTAVLDKLKDDIVTNKMLLDADAKLPKTISLVGDLMNGRYPKKVAAGADPAAKALGFQVEAQQFGGRCYYSTPEGQIKCCTELYLTDEFSKQAVSLRDVTVPNGSVGVILAVHFVSPA